AGCGPRSETRSRPCPASGSRDRSGVWGAGFGSLWGAWARLRVWGRGTSRSKAARGDVRPVEQWKLFADRLRWEEDDCQATSNSLWVRAVPPASKSGSRVARASKTIARVGHMSPRSSDFAVCHDDATCASPMHDIGKIGIPDHVLLKPGSLTPDEWAIMKEHASMGAEILGKSKSPYLKMGAEIALHHHERWDGGGYPQGKRGEEIPLAARIMSICDVYDALRSKRPYKLAYDHSKTMDIIRRGDGRVEPEHFDPAVLAGFEQNHQSFCDIYEAHEG
ncbi:MAG: hypothetical protein CO108_30095, partial [Deltaproteobacteria bacterium CG_4_9_14_3_um_filter_63_12]